MIVGLLSLETYKRFFCLCWRAFRFRECLRSLLQDLRSCLKHEFLLIQSLLSNTQRKKTTSCPTKSNPEDFKTSFSSPCSPTNGSKNQFHPFQATQKPSSETYHALGAPWKPSSETFIASRAAPLPLHDQKRVSKPAPNTTKHLL